MKPTPLVMRRRLFALALSVMTLCQRSAAQDLPRTLLELPPLPSALIASTSKPKLAGLPGGPAPVYTPLSQLTLPEKPSAIIAGGSPGSANPAPLNEGEEVLPFPEAAAVPDDLLQPTETPLLPGLPAPAGASPDSAPDLLPSPEEPGTSGIMEIEPAPPNAAEPNTTALIPPAPSTDDTTSPVSPSDLAPAPDKSLEPANPSARGPIFRIQGAAAIAHTRPLGYRFTPAMGQGRRDGIHTVASQVPNFLTSEVHGPRMMQRRPGPLWTTPYIENTFYMFCDPAYNAVRLQPGWKIRGIQLKGPHWQWVVCPKSGANTASFSIRIRAWKTIDTPTQGSVVTLQGLTLEGPPGATDWKAAFPSLLRTPTLAAKR